MEQNITGELSEDLALNQLFRDLIFAFPPPHPNWIRKEIYLLKSSSSNDIQTELQRVTIAVQSVRTGFSRHLDEERVKKLEEHLTAAQTIFNSLISPDQFPWEDSLITAQAQWGIWGAPWLLAAEYMMDAGKLKEAIAYTEAAHRLLPVCDSSHLKLLDNLRKKTDKLLEKSQDVNARMSLTEILRKILNLISLHRPSIINIERICVFARKINKWYDIGLGIERCLEIHGSDPSRWWVMDLYDEKSSAGSMCCLINIYEAKQQNKSHDYDRWSEAALNFLRSSLQMARPKNKSKKIVDDKPLACLFETIGNKCEYCPSKLDDDVFREEVSWVKDLIKHMASIDSASAYNKKRQLARILKGEIRYLIIKGANEIEIHDKISELLNIIEEVISLAYTKTKKTFFAKTYADFLNEVGYYKEAVELLARFSSEEKAIALSKIVGNFKRGARNEALRGIIPLIQNATIANDAFGFGNLFYGYYIKAQDEGITIRETRVDRAKDALKSKYPLLVKFCSKAIKEDRLNIAETCINVMRWVEGEPVSANVLHLSGRLNLKRVKEGTLAPEKAVQELIEAFTISPPLKDDGYISGIFLSILAEGDGQPAINADYVWQMAYKSGKSLDPYDLHSALRWQVRTNCLDKWADRYLLALRSFPTDNYIAALPDFIYRTRDRANPGPVLEILKQVFGNTIQDLLTMASGNDESEQSSLSQLDPARINCAAGILKILKEMSGEFYFEPGIVEQIFSLLHPRYESDQQIRHIAMAVIDGMARGQMRVWHDEEERTRLTLIAAELIARFLPENPLKWTQWLGAQRGEFERSVIERFKADVEALKEMNSREEEPPETIVNFDTIVKRLKELLKSYKEVTFSNGGGVQLSNGWAEIEKICIDSIQLFIPSKHDPTYWSKLHYHVINWISVQQPEEIVQQMTSAWMGLYLKMENILTERVGYVVYPPLHNFTKDLKRIHFDPSMSVPTEWKEKLHTMLEATVNYFKWRRWPQFAKVDLREVLEKAAYRPPFASIRRGDSSHNKLPWVYPVRPPNPVIVFGDRELLIEVVRSLIDNSAKQVQPRSEGGWVWVEVEQCGGNALLKVIDNGTGATIPIIEMLNDPFGEGFSGTGSTGYGTRSCHRIIALHDGKIHFSNREMGDPGLRVVITIPILKGEENEPV